MCLRRFVCRVKISTHWAAVPTVHESEQLSDEIKFNENNTPAPEK